MGFIPSEPSSPYKRSKLRINTMHYYTPFNGSPIAYTCDYTKNTHTLLGQPTLYIVGVSKPFTNEVNTLPYFPLKAHGQGVAVYEYQTHHLNDIFYAFTSLDDALEFANALMRGAPAIAVYHEDGTTGLHYLRVLNNK